MLDFLNYSFKSFILFWTYVISLAIPINLCYIYGPPVNPFCYRLAPQRHSLTSLNSKPKFCFVLSEVKFQYSGLRLEILWSLSYTNFQIFHHHFFIHTFGRKTVLRLLCVFQNILYSVVFSLNIIDLKDFKKNSCTISSVVAKELNEWGKFDILKPKPINNGLVYNIQIIALLPLIQLPVGNCSMTVLPLLWISILPN